VKPWLRTAVGLAATGALAAGGLTAYGFGIERSWLDVTRPSFLIPDLPIEFDGFVLAQLNDFHVGLTVSPNAAVRQAIASCNLQQPDAVVLTGDYASSRSGLATFESLLNNLETRPVYAVLGNHDYRFGPRHRQAIVNALQSRGMSVLDNRSEAITRHGRSLWLIGVGDGYSSHDRLDEATRTLNESDHPRILLTHYPDLLLQPLTTRIDLALAGHSHGAQIRLPFVTRRALRKSDTRFVSGIYRVRNIQLYVNRGLGTSGVPIRIRSRPEVALITLRSPEVDVVARGRR